MTSLKLITELYDETMYEITRNSENWTNFLKTASMNYKRSFNDIVLIYSQRPEAVGCTNLQTWNNTFNRWAKKGSKGIALLTEENGRSSIEYVFDANDTQNKYGKQIHIWSVGKHYENDIIESLENVYGELSEKTDIGKAIISATTNIVQDSLQDYLDNFSLIEKEMLENILIYSVSFMTINRCRLNPNLYIDNSKFSNIGVFNTYDNIMELGLALTELAKMELNEIHKVIKNLRLNEIEKIRTFDKSINLEYDVNEIERRDLDESELQSNRRLYDTQSDVIKESNKTTREIQYNEIGLSQKEQERLVHEIVNARRIGRTFGRNSGNIINENRDDNSGIGNQRESGRKIETNESNGLGFTYEQFEDNSRRNSGERVNLQLDTYNENISVSRSVIVDEKINQILSKTNCLKVSNNEIINYFNEEKDIYKRALFLKGSFNNDYTGIIVEDEMYGYKAFDNGVLFWKDNFLTRDSESFVSWNKLTFHYDSMILLHQLDTRVKNILSVNEQLSFLDKTDNVIETPTLEFSQEFIDKFLQDVSSVTKYRIYNQLTKSLSTKENIDFLKELYGIGGASHTVTGSGVGINYDSKGIVLYSGYSDNRPQKYLSWNYVEKRIKELIQIDRYFDLKEKSEYSLWLEENDSTNLISNEKQVTTSKFQDIQKKDNYLIHPEVKDIDRLNYEIKDNELGVGTPKEKYRNNISAIELLKKLEEENRLATYGEQEILARYVGWGGLQEAFDENNSSWKNEYDELKSLLTPNEYKEAMKSTLTAFYTPPIVIKAMYKALENLGFKNGNVLEPSCGIGNFLGLIPDSMDCKLYGVELDEISGKIARQLYQKSIINIQGYEKTMLPDSFFDIAIGNIPFDNFKLIDKKYDKYNFLIHDYFFAKTLDKVRPGGVIAFITSKGTLDKENPSVRKYLAQRANLLGAIRLPDITFKKNAGTEVTSDIIFLQKRDSITDIMPDWVYLGTDENGIKINNYFINNPNMIIGEMKVVSTRFGMDSACKLENSNELEERINVAVSNIKGEIKDYLMDDIDEEEYSIEADLNVKNFSYTIIDDKIYYRENSKMYLQDFPLTTANRVRWLIQIRDCVRKLIDLQTEDYSDDDIKNQQIELNKLYDEFNKKYGLINSRANNTAFSSDSSYYLLCSLEILDENGNLSRKADMFFKRTIKSQQKIKSVDNSSEALVVSISEKACVDMEFIKELTNKSENEIISDLEGAIFKLPNEDRYVTNDEYLSGNVRVKLKEAIEANESNPIYESNIKYLKDVQPKDLSASEISVRLGATWVPCDIVNEFIYTILETPYRSRYYIKVHYSENTSEWNIEGKSHDRGNVKAYSTYGTNRANAYRIIEDTLNLKDVRIYDYLINSDGKKEAVLNKKETAIAQAKQEQIKQFFEDWIWKDPNRRERVVKIYNEKFNAIRPREYDGSHINFSGMNPEITLRKHQVNAIARILYGGNTLLAHEVGAGKTFEMVAAAMESKRLGLCNKSLFVIPNHIIEQFASEFLQLYPSANILVSTKKDFETSNRKKFCSRIATGDYDAVIIGHSQFEKIPMSTKRQAAILEKQIADISQGIKDLKNSGGERFSIKSLMKTQKNLESKLAKLNDPSRKDDVVTFEELGVDRIFVDEAHYYKNLYLYTKMRNVGGIAQTEAQKSSDLFMKCRYLDELTGSKGIIFATGTPISNSMVEMFTMQRYLQYDTLFQHKLQHFDAWASTFGETVTAIEIAPEGTGYRSKTRFAKFYNLPELMNMFKEFADIQTADMLQLPVPKANYENIVVKPTDIQIEMVKSLAERAECVRNKQVDSSVDNMLKITNDGRKLALDQRLINDVLPDDDKSKIAICSQNIYEIWKKYEKDKLSQLVFCDLSTPTDDKFNIYDDLRKKLLLLGVPNNEIEFIHNANTEVKKKELFAKVRRGQVRILIGSTPKMGAGTNCQDKLIALHDLDCPWRPSDLIQRSGRIIRQGNQNKEVYIYRYVTEKTFDAYLYQLVENKQRFISQIMTSKTPVRSAEDIDETALSYAEIKALAAGNPLIIEKTELDTQVAKLKLLKQSHLSQIYEIEDKIIKYYPSEVRRLELRIESLEKDISHLKNNTDNIKFNPMTIKGKTHYEKVEAGSSLLNECQNM